MNYLKNYLLYRAKYARGAGAGGARPRIQNAVCLVIALRPNREKRVCMIVKPELSKVDNIYYHRVNIPGGRINPGETPEQCAHREWREEVGDDFSRLNATKRGEFTYHGHTRVFIYTTTRDVNYNRRRVLNGETIKMIYPKLTRIIDVTRIKPYIMDVDGFAYLLEDNFVNSFKQGIRTGKILI